MQWTTTTGTDGMPNYSGNSQRARIRYVFDSQDRALVPRYGIRSVSEFGYLIEAVRDVKDAGARMTDFADNLE